VISATYRKKTVPGTILNFASNSVIIMAILFVVTKNGNERQYQKENQTDP
jgi:hypothetical protein